MEDKNTFNENKKSKSNNSYKRSSSETSGSYLVDYGPIRVRHRLGVSRTIETGRRPTGEVFAGEDARKRETRRIKNRIAARELKQNRDKIELDLIDQLKILEKEQQSLQDLQKQLEERKAQLNRAVYNAKQTALIPLVTDIDIPVYIELQHRSDLKIDLQPLLKMLDESFFSSSSKC